MCAVMTLHPTSPNAPKINPIYFVPGINIRNKPNTMAVNASKRGAASWNKSPLKRGKVGSVFLMRETQKGYSDCTPFKWWFVV